MYVERDRAELKRLAIDIAAGLIVTNYGVPDKMLAKVFTPLNKLTKEDLASFKEDDICTYFQYVSKKVDFKDDFPVFSVFEVLNRKETQILAAYSEAIEAL
tara:strand:+ start:332 stop:634 length:303 start_codon:yes stop_codon:yes gene_type:complete